MIKYDPTIHPYDDPFRHIEEAKMSENRNVPFDTEMCSTNPEAAADKISELEDALRTVLASLVATTSLLVRSEDMKCRPSKAVASNSMFVQMLKDYDKATIIGRKALN